MTRASLLDALAGHLARLSPAHVLRVGIDGPCGSGKSTLARELAAAIGERGRPVIRLDSDGFHHTRERRYRQGRNSARGYYDDAYDFDALATRVLVPLGQSGRIEYAAAVHDLETDAVLNETAVADPGAILVFDATFLQRGPLRELWDEVIYLDVPLGTATDRGVARDAAAFGDVGAARAAYAQRYAAAWQIYVDEERPRERASVVIEYADPSRPRVLRGW